MLFTDKTLDEAAVSKLKADNGPVLRAVRAPLGIIIFKKPSREAWDRWQDKSLVSKASASADARELCQECLAAPCGYEDFVNCINDAPGLLQGEFMTALAEMAGMAEKFEIKKL